MPGVQCAYQNLSPHDGCHMQIPPRTSSTVHRRLTSRMFGGPDTIPGLQRRRWSTYTGLWRKFSVHLPLLVWPPFPRNWRRWRLLFVPWYRRHIRIRRSLGSIWYHVRAFRLRINSPFHVVSTFKLTCLSDIFTQVICMSDTRVGKRLAFNDEDEKRV